MKPIIGINMSYYEYKGDNHRNVKIRDFYKVYISYVDAVVEHNGVALLIPPFSKLSTIDPYIDMAQGFIFTGGDDYPPELYNEEKHLETKPMHKRRAKADIYLARRVLQINKPVLAICGGIQLINIAMGGKLIQHIEHLEMHNKVAKTRDNSHKIRIFKDSLLYDIFKKEEISVNSAHHQAVNPEYIGNNLRITATAEDNAIEALELKNNKDRFLLGVQWHPERIRDEKHKSLIFNAFITAVNNSVT